MIQFDLAYDPSLLSITAAAGNAAIEAGKDLITAVLLTERKHPISAFRAQ
jgi:hypothetical protein